MPEPPTPIQEPRWRKYVACVCVVEPTVFSFVCGLCVFLYVSRKKGNWKKKGLCVVKSRGWGFGVQPAVNISLFYIAELNYAHNLTRESLYDVYIWVLFFILSSGNQVPDLCSYFLSLFFFSAFFPQSKRGIKCVAPVCLIRFCFLSTPLGVVDDATLFFFFFLFFSYFLPAE